jgi:Dihaem cytochrome c
MALLLGAVAIFAGCNKSLPDSKSAAAQLYVNRCGSCHQAYPPQSMTAAMWELQMAAMAPKIAAAGKAPLSAAEQQEILAYLQAHAGNQ